MEIPDCAGTHRIPHRAVARIAAGGNLDSDFSTPVQLWVNRSAKFNRQRRKKTTRLGLFEKRDGAKADLIKK